MCSEAAGQMPRLEFVVEWHTPPGEEEAFGPERATWARLSLVLQDLLITVAHPADLYARADQDSRWVVGPMSGLAEWIVENWTSILWDIPTPFPKNPSLSSVRRPAPSLRDAAHGWQHFIDGDVSANKIAVWQHQHTLGHGTSDIALPSIVFLPEDKKIGIAVDHIPATLQPTVRFTPPASADAWPSDPVWLPRDEVAASLRRFVDQTIDRAASDPAAQPWLDWLRDRWDTAQREADDPRSRLRLMFGEMVAAQWSSVEKKLGALTAAMVGILFDVPAVSTNDLLDRLAAKLPVPIGRTQPFHPGEVDLSLPPHEQGYRLAARARAHLKIRDEPIVDIIRALQSFGTEVMPIELSQLFRSAVVRVEGNSRILYATDDMRFSGVAPTRFAIAAALGRLLSDGLAGGTVFGAAHGSHSRWLQTKLANAFAAEFLLPVDAIQRHGGNIDRLCDAYGISRTAATWHTHNRFDASAGSGFPND